jgi:hypothetical protein
MNTVMRAKTGTWKSSDMECCEIVEKIATCLLEIRKAA